jgi:hypothetical protein
MVAVRMRSRHNAARMASKYAYAKATVAHPQIAEKPEPGLFRCG